MAGADPSGPGPVVFFDLDGTLVDTTYLHTYAWWQALDDAGITVPMSKIHPLIGMGSSGVLETLVGHDDEALSEHQGERFRALHPSVRALPAAVSLIERVNEEGGRAVVVTSAKERDLEALFAPLGGPDVVSAIVHSADAPRPKPDPDPFAVAIERTGAEPRRALAVGDSVWDVEAAAKVGVACIGLQTGGIAREDLHRAGAVAVYRDCVDLLEHWPSSPMAALLSESAPPGGGRSVVAAP